MDEQRPKANNKWEMELYKIKTYYSSSFELINDNSDNNKTIRIIHYPTDPDFDVSIIPNGLIWEIDINNTYIKFFNSIINEEPTVILKTVNTNLNAELKSIISEYFKKIFCSILQNFKIFNTLKILDSKLVEIFKSLKSKINDPISTTWTNLEQKRLEEALVWYRRIKDPLKKWQQISEFVKTKNTKECLKQFKICRDFIIQQDSYKEKFDTNLFSNESNEIYSKVNIDSRQNEDIQVEKINGKQSSIDDNFTNSLRIIGLYLKDISLTRISMIQLQVACHKCETQFKVILATEKDFFNLNTVDIDESCKKCNTKAFFQFQPSFIFNKTTFAGSLKSEEAILLDVIYCNFIIICEECSSEHLVQNITKETSKTFICIKCHKKLTLNFKNIAISKYEKFDSIQCTITNDLSVKIENLKIPKKRVNKLNNPNPQIKPFKKNEPLPNFGTCKHYKKSYKWFRFPCCSMTYPCDICHDLASDHPYEWALKIICGYCSTEQSISGKPCSCGYLHNSKSTHHWEGGKGTRNKIIMNRKDKHKYTGLSKKK